MLYLNFKTHMISCIGLRVLKSDKLKGGEQ